MKVKYRKAAKGGYYAFVESEALDRTVCVIVTNHPYATGKVGNAGYWLASIGSGVKVMGDTRKEAVALAVAELTK